ncbi:MAG: hypothetical protein WC788_08050 [Candidatus Paceibacterota bacterium]|jgi:hypothetical protein
MGKIPLNNFSLMRDDSPVLYAENFGIRRAGLSKLLMAMGYANNFLSEDTATMKKEAGNTIATIQGMDSIGTELSTMSYWLIDDNSNIWVSNYAATGYKLINTNEPCWYPDIKALGYGDDDSVIYTHNNSVGRIYRGLATGGSTTTLVDTSVDFTTLGLVAGDLVYNVTDNTLATINAGGIAANTLTITFVAGSAGGSFANTEKWAIVDPDWAALTDDEYTYSRQIIEFDEDFYILNGDALAQIVYGGAYVTTGFTAEFKLLESGYIARCGASNGDTTCVGANKNSRGKLFIWDKNSNGWNKKISIDNEVLSVIPYKNGYIYITSRAKLFFTDGYSTRTLSAMPGTNNRSDISINPKGMIVVEDVVYILGGAGSFSKDKKGIHVYFIEKDEWAYYPYDDTGTLGLAKHSHSSVGGILFWESSMDNLFYSASIEQLGNTKQCVLNKFLPVSLNNQGTVILGPVPLGKDRSINKIEVNMLPDEINYDASETEACTVICKLSDCHKPTWRYAQAKIDSANANEITIDATINGFADAEVGDEIVCVQGYNGFLRREITAISGADTATELWTLDSALPNVTKDNTYILVSPFRYYGMTSSSVLAQSLLEFHPEFIGDNVMIQIEIKGTASQPHLGIESVTIYYE